MMTLLHQRHFPGESENYRQARNQLLQEELKLRQQIEHVAQLRRQLPQGGELQQDYLLTTNNAKKVKFSDLFEQNKNTLVIYSFMYGSKDSSPCPMCTAFLDNLNGSAKNVQEKVNLAVIAKAPFNVINSYAINRQWNALPLYSSQDTSYNKDYFGENDSGDQIPCMNVFIRKQGKIFHFYSTELLFINAEKNQEPRHIDLMWPLWNILDLTPEGRGNNWYPTIE